MRLPLFLWQLTAAAAVNYQLKDFENAIEFGNRAIRAECSDPRIQTIVAQAYLSTYFPSSPADPAQN
jgi:hypothetical protein